MSDDFQQTVNLKEKMEQQKEEQQRRLLEKKRQDCSRIVDNGIREELQKIDKPVKKENKSNSGLIQFIVFILVFLIIGFTVYSLFFKNLNTSKKIVKNQSWYAVKLVNNETFYGQIEDTKTDPIVMSNVYYNYDQEKDDKKEIPESSNLRLVKRGKETHGPAGTMDLIRSQVLFMEPLKTDSKVLEAILKNEK